MSSGDKVAKSRSRRREIPVGQPVIGAHLEEGVIEISPLPVSAALPTLPLLVALSAYFVLRWWDSQTSSTRDD